MKVSVFIFDRGILWIIEMLLRKYIIEKVTQAVIYLRKNLSEVASNYVN
ncbi:Uncharacterised protein [Orientia tsutsugamushi]|uniref:Uncharacterized protein n=1 Tax=Orientia tsutsugamushi TaxID=784 RepID=A0A2U3QYT5_ORITS|nr:Uncharacterised protein [Orientia tsutsugamushi]